MKKTFYLAGPYETREKITELSQDLLGLGYEWAFDWTGEENSISSFRDPKAVLAVSRDIQAAINAKLFVAHLTPPYTARGTHMEISARATHWGTCHVVLNGDKGHMFYALPHILTYDTWEEFMEWVRRKTYIEPGATGFADGSTEIDLVEK